MIQSLAYALVGHLVGDYIFQNDWMAQNKKGDLFPPRIPGVVDGIYPPIPLVSAAHDGRRRWASGTLACSVHCLLWTSSVLAFSEWWRSLWTIPVLFLTHYLQDRTKIIRWWMSKIGQDSFAAPPLGPWSIIVVDNVFHVVTLAIIGYLIGAH